MRKKIILGLSSIAFLLILAGIISYFEISRYNEQTIDTISDGTRGINMVNELMDCIVHQDTILLGCSERGDFTRYSEISGSQAVALDSVLTTICDSIPQFNSKLVPATRNYINALASLPPDSLFAESGWYTARFRPAYSDVTVAAKDYIIEIREDMVAQTRVLQAGAYRANMQSITALLSGVILLIGFFFLIDIYFITPVLKISKSLGGYLYNKTSFKPEFEGKTEVTALKEHIELLIKRLKAKQ